MFCQYWAKRSAADYDEIERIRVVACFTQCAPSQTIEHVTGQAGHKALGSNGTAALSTEFSQRTLHNPRLLPQISVNANDSHSPTIRLTLAYEAAYRYFRAVLFFPVLGESLPERNPFHS
jgi:hypothetical protein